MYLPARGTTFCCGSSVPLHDCRRRQQTPGSLLPGALQAAQLASGGLLFDPAEQLRSLLDALASSQPTGEAPGGLNLGELQAQWVAGGTSLFALRHQLEPLVCAVLPDPLLIVLPQRQEADCRATLLELIRAGTVFQAQLVNRARVYLREVMEPEKVEQLLKRPDLTYRDIALALEQSGDGGFSQLKALFRQQLGGMGSPPENAELARL